MKKLLVILLAVGMIFAFAACATTEEPATEDTSATDVQEEVAEEATAEIQLGETGYFITAEGFVSSESQITKAESENDMIAYYVNEAANQDFDIYQWDAEGALDAEVAEDAAAYEAEVEMTEINGIAVGYYEATETWEDAEYTTLNYTMDYQGTIVQVVFWTENEEDVAAAEAIMATLAEK